MYRCAKVSLGRVLEGGSSMCSCCIWFFKSVYCTWQGLIGSVLASFSQSCNIQIDFLTGWDALNPYCRTISTRCCGGLPELNPYCRAGFEARRRRLAALGVARRKWRHRLQLEPTKPRTHFSDDARKQSKLPQIIALLMRMPT